jgi:GT2 family glycosyltransferase
MADNPRITNVIASYSTERNFAREIEGVLKQAYSPVHIIVMDDATSDKTPKAFKSFGNIYIRSLGLFDEKRPD